MLVSSPLVAGLGSDHLSWTVWVCRLPHPSALLGSLSPTPQSTPDSSHQDPWPPIVPTADLPIRVLWSWGPGRGWEDQEAVRRCVPMSPAATTDFLLRTYWVSQRLTWGWFWIV